MRNTVAVPFQFKYDLKKGRPVLTIKGDFRDGMMFNNFKHIATYLLSQHGSELIIDVFDTVFMDSDTMEFMKMADDMDCNIIWDTSAFSYKVYDSKYPRSTGTRV